MTRDFPTGDAAEQSRLENLIFVDLLAALMFSVLAFGAVEAWSLALFELNALVLASLIALKFVLDPLADWGRLRLALPLLALAGWGAIQYTRSFDPYATKEAAIKLFALGIYFAAALLVLHDPRRRKTALLALTAFGFLVSVYAIVNLLTYNGRMYWVRPISDYIAPYGPFGNYNHFCGFVELILPLTFAYVLLARISIERRLIWLFCVVMMAVALILSLSRSGILVLGAEVSLLLLAVTLGRRWLARGDRNGGDRRGGEANGLLILGVLVVVAALAFWLRFDQIALRFRATSAGASEYSVVTRLEYWRASWRMFLDHPVAGVGLGAFPAVYPQYGRSTAKYERLEQAHNDYLQLLTDTGLIGAAIALWFLAEVLRLARRQFKRIRGARSRSRALIAGGYTGVIGLLIHSVTDFNLQIASNALLFLFVLALATSIRLHTSQR